MKQWKRQINDIRWKIFSKLSLPLQWKKDYKIIDSKSKRLYRAENLYFFFQLHLLVWQDKISELKSLSTFVRTIRINGNHVHFKKKYQKKRSSNSLLFRRHRKRTSKLLQDTWEIPCCRKRFCCELRQSKPCREENWANKFPESVADTWSPTVRAWIATGFLKQCI